MMDRYGSESSSWNMSAETKNGRRAKRRRIKGRRMVGRIEAPRTFALIRVGMADAGVIGTSYITG